MKNLHERGQAVAEMAIFGSIVIFVLSVLIAYVQKLNDQQLSKMESFRRALQKATTYQDTETESPGASVQYLLVQHRRHADLAGGFGKGITVPTHSDASVYWAIPTASHYGSSGGGASTDMQIARINDDERSSTAAGEFSINLKSGTDDEAGLEYNETKYKGESKGSIVNSRDSARKETVTTTFPGADIKQYSYRDPSGQYRYYSEVPSSARRVQKRMQWQTAH
ncbi:MAG: hypothetical protein PHT31_05430 [Candidatus Omnitrophica bacterium]|nr:hypothetical protein [Candidatus Omnitrophota bacterium]MDD5653581.1 hypothetical protein [Candidatus Omnitrophota bacterium]